MKKIIAVSVFLIKLPIFVCCMENLDGAGRREECQHKRSKSLGCKLNGKLDELLKEEALRAFFKQLDLDDVSGVSGRRWASQSGAPTQAARMQDIVHADTSRNARDTKETKK